MVNIELFLVYQPYKLKKHKTNFHLPTAFGINLNFYDIFLVCLLLISVPKIILKFYNCSLF